VGNVTVSGLSAGGFMAVQLHVAHSSIVKGAGVIAGGPYYCAQDSLWTAYFNCRQPGGAVPLPATATLHAEVERQAKAGRIDATANLAGTPAWLFGGNLDKVVTRDVVEGLNGFYASYKVDTTIVRDKPAGHAMPTLDAGNADCSVSASPYINDCDFDGAGELLKKLLGPLQPPAAKQSGRLARFDQKPFAADPKALSMGAEGYAYIPAACEKESCRIHVALHGCMQTLDDIGDRFVRLAGYNRWADTNHLIVLYPQAIARSGWSFGTWSFVWNPNGCWDWWGYTGALYHTKEGPQIRALKAMLERLSAPR
jgi:poly(3-hydroxybutyrate) depolymerase